MPIAATYAKCHKVIKRIEIERRVASKAVKTFLAAGYQLGVNDGEVTTIKRSTSYKAIMEALGSTDEDYLLIYDEKRPADDGKAGRVGYLYFVYGNSGYDLISDWSAKKDLYERFEQILKPVDDYASRFDK